MLAWINWAVYGYDVPAEADEKQLHQRHLCMCTIRNSKIKLKPVKPVIKKKVRFKKR